MPTISLGGHRLPPKQNDQAPNDILEQVLKLNTETHILMQTMERLLTRLAGERVYLKIEEGGKTVYTTEKAIAVINKMKTLADTSKINPQPRAHK